MEAPAIRFSTRRVASNAIVWLLGLEHIAKVPTTVLNNSYYPVTNSNLNDRLILRVFLKLRLFRAITEAPRFTLAVSTRVNAPPTTPEVISSFYFSFVLLIIIIIMSYWNQDTVNWSKIELMHLFFLKVCANLWIRARAVRARTTVRAWRSAPKPSTFATARPRTAIRASFATPNATIGTLYCVQPWRLNRSARRPVLVVCRCRPIVLNRAAHAMAI